MKILFCDIFERIFFTFTGH